MRDCQTPAGGKGSTILGIWDASESIPSRLTSGHSITAANSFAFLLYTGLHELAALAHVGPLPLAVVQGKADAEMQKHAVPVESRRKLLSCIPYSMGERVMAWIKMALSLLHHPCIHSLSPSRSIFIPLPVVPRFHSSLKDLHHASLSSARLCHFEDWGISHALFSSVHTPLLV